MSIFELAASTSRHLARSASFLARHVGWSQPRYRPTRSTEDG